MARQMSSDRDTNTTTTSSLVSPDARITKRRYKRVRRFENGLLDVERKTGKFFKLVIQNQRDSPLLRMPPEIRNRIYTFALGGNTYVLHKDEDTKTIINKSKSQNALALLCVSRQIYGESAMLPFSLNIFSSNRPSTLKSWLSKIRPIYRDNITRIDLSTESIRLLSNFHICSYTFYKPEDWTFQELPLLRHINLTISISSFLNDDEKALRTLFASSGKVLERLLAASGKNVKVATYWTYLTID